MNDIFMFLISDRFLFWGILIFYIFIPLLIFILVFIIDLIFDFSEFKQWRKEKNIDVLIKIKKNELDSLKKQKKEKTID